MTSPTPFVTSSGLSVAMTSSQAGDVSAPLESMSAEVNTRVRATTLNETVEIGYLYVTCGTVMGKLHKDKFYCPGIHMQCIELEDGEMTSPRKMVTLADKERLKDWKTAVRVNGIPIRCLDH